MPTGTVSAEITAHDLQVLAICHYIMAGVIGFFALGYAGLINMMFANLPQGALNSAPAPMFRWFLGVLFVVMTLFGLGYALCAFLAGRFLAKRRHHTYCMVIAAIGCLHFPFGTVLSIFTFIVLGRPGVRESFRGVPPPLPSFTGA